MSDTKQRIAEYKQLLPGLKERVVAVALLLVISLTMVTTTTFAWVVLSRNPEVGGMTTTLAANGNLEIALANWDGNVPSESKIGDSFVAQGQTISSANQTWGNLINLSDVSYGLEYLTLRPARLNDKGDLRKNPLYAAVYTAGGRVDDINSDFAYTQWNETEKDFVLSSGYGVRAISSTKVKATEESYQIFLDKKKTAENAIRAVGDKYEEVANNNEYMEILAYLMGIHMTSSLNGTSEEDMPYHNPNVAEGVNGKNGHPDAVSQMIELYETILTVFESEAQAMADLVNLQLYLQGKAESYTAEELLSDTMTSKILSNQGVIVSSYDSFKKDYNLIKDDLEQLRLIEEHGLYEWRADVSAYQSEGLTKNLFKIVSSLVVVNDCEIRVRNSSDKSTKISELLKSLSSGDIGAMYSTYNEYNKKNCDTVITNGVFYNMASRIGRNLTEVGWNGSEGLEVSATVYVSTLRSALSATLYAVIATNAEEPFALYNDLSGITYSGDNMTTVVTAKDTYGMAIDLWVRTNAAASYLVLEGNVLTKTETVDATTKDPNGNEVTLYSLTRTRTDEQSQESITETYELYQLEGIWYNENSHTEFSLEDGEVPRKKTIQVETVIGYEGDNRVWDEYDPNSSNIDLNVNKTTQGSGSCYVFYFNTPEEKVRSLTLLESLKVVFLDTKSGVVLATAHMDTNRYYEDNGKITVPLALDVGSLVASYDSNGNPIYAITSLEQNVPMMITALVYLDGLKITNNEVLNESNIQGKLNIQFGSSLELHPINDDELENEEIDISATITGATEFDFATSENLTTDVKVTVATVAQSSYEAKTVTAYFVRMLNDSQGIREKTPVVFEMNADGDWVSEYTFTSPGRYIIRSVFVNGVEYDVDSPFPEVVVSGFEVGNITYGLSNSILTAASSYTGQLSFTFNGQNIKMPDTVQGRFVSADNLSTATVTFAYDPTQGEWKGNATFYKSGEYTFEYLIIDGDYYYIDESAQFTTNISLGIKVEVYTTSPTTFKYQPSTMADNEKKLAMSIKIFDNSNKEIVGLSDVSLSYMQSGSSNGGMYAGLKWNGETYSGELEPQNAGRFIFGYVKIGEKNIIFQAEKSPVFTLISPDPPQFVSASSIEYVYAPNNDARFEVVLAYAAGTDITATIQNKKTGATHTVPYVAGSEATDHPNYNDYPDSTLYYYYFTINADEEGKVNGTQDGEWTLLSISSVGGYDANGNQYTEDDPWTYVLSASEQVSSKVVSTLNIEFVTNTQTNFSGNHFMEAYTVSSGALSVKISDVDGKPIQGIQDVVLKFTYVAGTSGTYGGYTSDSLNSDSNGAVVTIPFATNDKMMYTQNQAVSFLYAGAYATNLSFTIDADGEDVGGKGYPVSYTYDGKTGSMVPLTDMPVITVSTVTPTVQIKSISPTGTFDVDASGVGSGHQSATVPAFTATSATVYFKCSRSGSGSTCDPYRHNYSRPSVTIELAGIGRASGASLDFGNNVHIYNNTTQTTGYSWTADDTCSRNIGYYRSRTAANDDKAPAGTLTSSTLILTYKNYDYTVTVPTITINNPY